MLRARPSYSQDSIACEPNAARIASRGTCATRSSASSNLVRERAKAWPQDAATDTACTRGGIVAERTAERQMRLFDARLERQAHGERTALPFAALDFEGAAVVLDDLARTGQPEASTGDATLDVRATGERLENRWQVGRGDADAFVVHLQHREAILTGDAHVYGATLWAVLDRIADQVVEDPLQSSAIPQANDMLGVGVQREDVSTGVVLVLGDGLPRELHQVGTVHVEDHLLSGLDAAHLQELVDPVGHTRGSPLDLLEATARGLRFGVGSPVLTTSGELCLDLDNRERGAQIMRDAGEHGVAELNRLCQLRRGAFKGDGAARDELDATEQDCHAGRGRQDRGAAAAVGRGRGDHEQQIHRVVVGVVQEAVVVDQDQVDQAAVDDTEPQLPAQHTLWRSAGQNRDPRERERNDRDDAQRVWQRGHAEGHQHQRWRGQEAEPEPLQQALEGKAVGRVQDF